MLKKKPQEQYFQEEKEQIVEKKPEVKTEVISAPIEKKTLDRATRHILKKFKKAKTADAPTEKNQELPVEIANLFTLMEHVSSKETKTQFVAAFNDCTIRYGDLKIQLAKDTNNFLAPVREKIIDLRANDKYLKEVAEFGKEKARKSAQTTLALVRDVMGFNYFK